MSERPGPYRVAVIGCGLMGERRARAAAEHALTTPVVLVDRDATRAERLASALGVARAADWRSVIERPDVDVVAVCTPNGYLAEIGCAALAAGKHVLLEKPMGRSAAEASMLAEAQAVSGRVLKVGFNHRYHSGIARALQLARGGELGRLVNIRARYGHGGRPGYEREWRGDPEMAGGGHLTDQGVHLLDLIYALVGLPSHAVAFLQTAVWGLGRLEDNAFATLRFPNGEVAQLHTGMTQWKNLFSLEIYGEDGSACVEGLSGSYGPQRLVLARRSHEGGPPEMSEMAFPTSDISWRHEWDDFVTGLTTGEMLHGSAADGVAVMRMLDVLYESARAGKVVGLGTR